MHTAQNKPIAAVSVLIADADKYLLVRRCNPPNAGKLALPGGKIEFGEPAKDAACRELLEETGIHAHNLGLINAVDSFEYDQDGLQRHFIILVYFCRWHTGIAKAADDACELVWLSWPEIEHNTKICQEVIDCIAQANLLQTSRLDLP